MKIRWIFLVFAAAFVLNACEKDPQTEPDPNDPDPDPDPSPTAWITNMGGEINWKDLQLTVAPDCFNQGFQLTATELDGSDYLGEDAASAFYRIEGIPMHFKKDLIVNIKPQADLTGTVFGVLMEHGRVTGENGSRNTMRFMEGAMVNDKFIITIPPFDDVDAAPSLDTLHIFVGLIRNYEQYSSKGHFAIYGSEQYASVAIDLGNYLEDAYDKFISSDFGFDYSRRTKWPVKVTIKDLGGEKDGVFVPSKWGNNHGTIEIDDDLMSDKPALRATAAHEFFHLVQALYDPRWGFTKGTSKPSHFWLEEAASVWSEGYFSENPNYVSTNRGGNEKEPFKGWLYDINNKPAEHGYGMSALLKYISNSYGTSKIKAVFQKIYDGESDIKNAFNTSLTDPLSSFYDEFIDDYMQKKIYNDMSPERYIIDNNGNFDIQTANDTYKAFESSYEGLSANVYVIKVSYDGLSDQAALKLSNVGEGKKYAYRVKGSVSTGIGIAGGELIIPNLKSFQEDNARIMVVVVNQSYNNANIKLEMEITQPPVPTWNQISIYFNDMPVVFQRLELPENTTTTYNSTYNGELRDWSNSGSGNANYLFTASWDYVQFNRTHTGTASLEFDPVNQLLLNGIFDYHEVSLDNPTYNFRNISFKLGTVAAGVSASAAEISVMGNKLCNPTIFYDFEWESSTGSPATGQTINTIQSYECPDDAEVKILLQTF